MDGEELSIILCRMDMGMSLTVPDAWIERKVAGPNAKRAARVGEIALSHGCVVKHGIGVQTFEKVEYPRLG